MKIIKKLSISALMLFTLFFGAKAQVEVAELLNGSLKDANILGKAYLEPFGKGFGTSLNSGWYNTAKPHKLFGFDLTFTVSTTILPSNTKTFNVPTDLEFWALKSGESVTSPTVSGDKSAGSILVPKVIAPPGTELQLPKGAGLKFVPAPMIQAGIGLPFNTEVDFRILPKIKIPDAGEFSLWGFGIKNEFKEFIPGLKAVPIDISAFFGYTKFTSSFDVDAAQTGNTKQTLDFNAKGYTAKLLVSKSIPVLTVYAGAGYSKTTTDIALKGNYTVPNAGFLGDVTDPLKFDAINKGFSANAGLRLKLAIITFHFDYTFGEYKIYSGGFGISFR